MEAKEKLKKFAENISNKAKQSYQKASGISQDIIERTKQAAKNTSKKIEQVYSTARKKF
jgi:polyhydroxyalkanoate synthesis regulator phasin